VAASNLGDLLDAHPFAETEPVLHTIDRSMTAGEARAAARDVAAGLRAAGIQSGNAVAVQLPNGLDLVTTIFGVWRAGAVFVPVNWRAPEAEVERALTTVGAAALVRPDGIHRRERATAYDGDTAFVQWTSGTTGEPKAILHTHSAYLELLDRVLGPLAARRRDPNAAPTPNLIPVSLALNAGIYNLLFGLRAGAAVVVMERFDTTTFAELVRRFQIRSTVLPPAAITMLNDDPAIDDLPPLRYVRSITAQLPPAAARRFVERFGVAVLNGYGQAEIGEVIGWTAADAREHPDKIGAAGRPHPGVEIKILPDDEGGEGGIGELAVRPPRMAAGYVGGGGLADRLDADGFLRTGDLARVDADGFVWIEGRVGEVINRGGNKVFPAQVEEVLLLSPGVKEAAVAAVPDDRLGEVPVAFVVGDADPDELTALCRDHLVPYKVPVAFHHVDELPRSEVGKVLRRELVASLDHPGDTDQGRSGVAAVAIFPSSDAKTALDDGRLAIGPDTTAGDAVAAVRAWVDEHVPEAWRDAARRGGPAAIREVRSRADYEAWYPVFGRSGLVAPTWPVAYGGLDLDPAVARAVEAELHPYNLGRLNPLGLNLAAPALFSHGTEAQRLRFLPPIVRNEEQWCQLFSEPGAGSDLASLATRAERDGDDWLVTGQKVWTTWAHRSDLAVLLARTDPEAPKRKGITYFLIDLHQPGVEVRPLRHLGGEIDFNEVFLDHARVPDDQRVGGIGDGWRVAGATLSGERQMVSGAGSGGVDRIGGSGVRHLIELARARAANGRPETTLRQDLTRLYSEERIRAWTNDRVRAQVKAGRAPGPESSIGKVHQGELNQRVQELAVRIVGLDAVAWESSERDYAASLPYEVAGMLRSRANTIEGGTTEINKNVVGERVLGLPREPDPWRSAPWREIPRS
jgi:acyl-CoA synthetase (AMP-forming)/AMP-acid ligase II/alkylation response protein AidB-like acyl-CoA dehydrogenase